MLRRDFLQSLTFLPFVSGTRNNAPPGPTPTGGSAVSVLDYGADNTGATNAQPAIQSAQLAAGAHSTIYFPAGTYQIDSQNGVILFHDDVIYRGAGMHASTLQRGQTHAAQIMVQSSGAYPIQRVVFEDLAFDAAFGVVLYGAHVCDEVVFRRCRFTRGDIMSIGLYQARNVTIEDCVFDGAGLGRAKAIQMTAGGRDLTVTNCRFSYCYDGVIIDNGSSGASDAEPARNIRVTGCTFDGGWYYLKPDATGTGSYTANTLTDSGAAFGGYALNSRNVLVLPERESGTASYGAQGLTDNGAAFLSAGVKVGEIVRTSDRFGIVAAVPSETAVHIEAWQWLSDYTAAPPPAAGTAYTLYGVVIGLVQAATATTLTVVRWFDLNGTAVTPAADTRYEVLPPHPNYHLNCEYATEDLRVSNNYFVRGWSDMCSTFGNRAQIVNNVFHRAQDGSITANGRYNIVSGNRCEYTGAHAIFVSGGDGVISDNVCLNTQWVNSQNLRYIGGITLYGAARAKVIGNHCENAAGLPLGYYGIALTQGAIDVDLAHNTTRGHVTAGLRVDDMPGEAYTIHLADHRSHDETEVSTYGNGTILWQ